MCGVVEECSFMLGVEIIYVSSMPRVLQGSVYPIKKTR